MYPEPSMLTAAEAISQGVQARKENNLPAARAHYAHAAKLYRDHDDTLAYAHTIRHIADMFQAELNLAEAKPLYEESLELYRTNLDTKLLDLANTVRPYALLNEHQGNFDLAKQLWQEARYLYKSLRIDAGISECEAHLAELVRHQVMKVVPVIKSGDLNRSLKFYTEVLDFERKWPGYEDRELANGVVDLIRNGAELQLSRHANDGVFGSVNRVFVDDVDERCITFRQRGLDTTQRPESPIHTAPVDQTWGLREFAVTDPDGNNLCFCTPLE